ncbi:hypothetical protein [Bradyrhizobium zhanjiangense]|uniref:hypothetical protein n=1 Tax=Bradyrhizobium zhanjiangense TaxID=1325107 RepID=UPI001FDFEBF0|nr:hypothetical protein [Bradyrhizobium zhanjiangense]
MALATARRFATEGARVAILDIDAAAAAGAASSFGTEHIGVPCESPTSRHASVRSLA